MTDKLRKILDNMHKYNMEHLANINFGLSEEVVYDALVVSDNSATGVPLVGRSEEVQKVYEYSRKVVLIDLICKITRM